MTAWFSIWRHQAYIVLTIFQSHPDKTIYWSITLTIVIFSMYLKTLAATNMDDEDLTESMQKLLIVMQRLDEKIAPMLDADGELFNSK